jgi:hypothetical protein
LQRTLRAGRVWLRRLSGGHVVGLVARSLEKEFEHDVSSMAKTVMIARRQDLRRFCGPI